MATTELYEALCKAEKAFNENDLSLDLLNAYEAAERAYGDAVAAKRAEWNTLPASDDKSSAEENADDTEDCELDRLRWLEVAIAGYYL